MMVQPETPRIWFVIYYAFQNALVIAQTLQNAKFPTLFYFKALFLYLILYIMLTYVPNNATT